MTVELPSPLDGGAEEQRTFSVVHAADPGRVYCLGAKTEVSVLAVWLDPGTARPVFGCFLSMDDAMRQLSRKLGACAPLELVMHQAPEYADLERFYDEMVLVKVACCPLPQQPERPQ